MELLSKKKKLFAALIILSVVIIAFTGCGDSSASNNGNTGQNVQENISQESDASKQTNEPKEVENSIAYPNYEGYPIADGDITYHKMIINGKEYFLDAYSHNDNPDALYFSPTPIIYDFNGNAVGASSKGKETWAFNFADSFALMINGSENVNIDGELFVNVAPEVRKHAKYGDVFYCGTFFLIKMLDATVNFSDDRSAVYLTTNKEVSLEDTNAYELHLTAEGTLVATNATKSTEIKMDVAGNYSANELKKTAVEMDNDQNVKYRIVCSGCGGSGHVGSTISTYNPNSKMYEMKQDYRPCPNCGGKGYMILYK